MRRSFNRFELKYLVGSDQVQAVSSDLEQFLRRDAHGDGGRYALASLYYDSPDLTCYWAKIDGLKVRRKLRIRHYESSAVLRSEDPVFVEIKQRVNRVTQKRRVCVPYAAARGLCAGVEPDHVDREDEAVVGEVLDMAVRYAMRPAAITSYRREAFVGGELDEGLRVTFDRDLRYRLTGLDLDRKVPGPHLLSPELAVMEVKVDDRVPAWLTRIISRHDLSVVRISKYCAAIEAGHRHRGPAGVQSVVPATERKAHHG